MAEKDYLAQKISHIDNPFKITKGKKIRHFSHIIKNSIIGTNATIVCRNNIGEFAFIRAGSLVTKEVKPNALQLGNPPKQIGWVSEFGYKLNLIMNVGLFVGKANKSSD